MAHSTTTRGGTSTAAAAAVHTHYARYIDEIFRMFAVAAAVSTGIVSLTPIQIPFGMTLDRLGFICVNVAAGNSRLGIYYDNGDLPDGGALIVETASVAVVVNQKNELIIADTSVPPGLYWLASQFDNVACNYYPHLADQCRGGTLQTRRYNQAYGAFTDPCPATILLSGDFSPWQFTRVASVP